jgi:surface polysaccharide O-acyltransferase-like enzyme
MILTGSAISKTRIGAMATNAQRAVARSAAVDVAKLVAAAAVVWIHVTACDESRAFLPLCRFAVPFFTCAAVYFVLHKASLGRDSSFLDYSARRARRLYVPFLVWSFLYLAIRLVKQELTGAGSPIVWTPALLLNGTAHHLWFLPFICVVTIAAFGLSQRFGLPRTENRKRWALMFALIGTAFALAPCPANIAPMEHPLGYFIDHAWNALPSAFLGAALFCLMSVLRIDELLRRVVLCLGLLCVGLELMHRDYTLTPHLAAASFLFFASTQPERKWMNALQPWAEVAFVIYLVHVLFVEGLQMVSERFGGVTSLPADLSVWALSLVASAIAAKILLRVRVLAWASPQ